MNDQPKTITLTNGYKAIVDTDDYDGLNKYRWSYVKGYAIRCIKIDDRWGSARMHRVINETPDGFDTDHINHNKLDNRKANLRTATRQQNLMNQLPRKNGTSEYKGVYWHKRDRKWVARIMIAGKQKSLGYFTNEKDAAGVYDKAARELFGEYSVLNSV